MDENFEGSCILKLYHAYLGSTRSNFVKEMATMESHFDESDSKESDEDDE